MPELPEVEVIRVSLDSQTKGKRLTALSILGAHVLMPEAGEHISRVTNTTVGKVDRWGKCLAICLENGWTMLIHLRMTGRLLWNPPPEAWDRHTHWVGEFRGGDGNVEWLVYNDVRKFGRLDIAAPGKAPESEMLENFGPDILTASEKDFVGAFGERRTQLKSALLDQRIFSGLGNIYVDEILFDAGLHPKRSAASLDDRRLKRLFGSVRKILDKAIATGGSTVRDYLHTDGGGGRFQRYHRVYQRRGQKCYRCRTPIGSLKVAGRTSSFCPRCQPES